LSSFEIRYAISVLYNVDLSFKREFVQFTERYKSLNNQSSSSSTVSGKSSKKMTRIGRREKKNSPSKIPSILHSKRDFQHSLNNLFLVGLGFFPHNPPVFSVAASSSNIVRHRLQFLQFHHLDLEAVDWFRNLLALLVVADCLLPNRLE
jgi:hypothetical protein